jgi:hypothetical protein
MYPLREVLCLVSCGTIASGVDYDDAVSILFNSFAARSAMAAASNWLPMAPKIGGMEGSTDCSRCSAAAFSVGRLIVRGCQERGLVDLVPGVHLRGDVIPDEAITWMRGRTGASHSLGPLSVTVRAELGPR